MSTTIVRPLDLDSFHLGVGSHQAPPPNAVAPEEACLLELCAFMAGEPWSDRPHCVCGVLGAFGRRLQDALPDDKRQLLKPLAPKMLGTADDGHSETRRWMAADWAVHVGTPMWMDAANRADYAAELRTMAPIVDRASFDAVQPRLREIADACWEARKAARQSVYDKAYAAAKKAIAEGKDAVAVAAAAADAAAVAVAAAAAVAVAVAAAAAVAAADAEKFQPHSDEWYAIRSRVYKEIRAATKARILERYQTAVDAVHDSAIELFGRMVHVGRAS